MSNKSNYKRLVTSHYDWYNLLALERFKINAMAKDFEKHHSYVGWEKDVRDMKLCVKLLDIIMDEDSINKNWEKEICYINTKNYKRFVSIEPSKYYLEKLELRRIKALHLYNKIRNRVLRWWW